MRNGTHIVDLSYDQLRSSFDRTATLVERARRFRADRIEAISTGLGGRPLVEGPICVLHFIPVASMAGNRHVDIQALLNNFMEYAFGWSAVWRATNLDGLIVYPGRGANEAVKGFTHVFRSGALEAVQTGAAVADPTSKIIPSLLVARFFRTAIEKFLRASLSLGFTGPATVGANLLRVGEYQFQTGREWHSRNATRADREHLILPETWLEDIGTTESDAVARPLLDVLWQAFDAGQCDLYDDKGQWQPE